MKEITEYLCEVCGLVFYADYGVVDYCPKCGANDKCCPIREVTILNE